MRVDSIELRLAWNSFSIPTLKAILNRRFVGIAPVGTSKSSKEAIDIPPSKALRRFEKVKHILLGNFTLRTFDERLKELLPILGASATTALSLAFFNATFSIKKVKYVPSILGNLLGGGKHSPSVSRQRIQEILIVPKSRSVKKCIELSSLAWHRAKEELEKLGVLLGLNLEFAWVHKLADYEALKFASKLCEEYDLALGVDIAATHFYRDGKYRIAGKLLGRRSYLKLLSEWIEEFDLRYIEDPFEENDVDSFIELRSLFSNRVICGDDLVASDKERFIELERVGSINAVIVKPNQVGLVSPCIDLIETAKRKGCYTVVSHRSQETEDLGIAKLALLSPLAKFSIGGIDVMKRNFIVSIAEELKLRVSLPKTFL